MKNFIYLLVFLFLGGAAFSGDYSYIAEMCAKQLFPSGNVESVVLGNINDLVFEHAYGEQMDTNAEYYVFSRNSGSVQIDALNLPDITEDVLIQANTFKSLINLHFGVGAETNKTITQNYVVSYFVNRRINGTADINDASDALILQNLFQSLSGFTPDGTTWSFPWEALP